MSDKPKIPQPEPVYRTPSRDGNFKREPPSKQPTPNTGRSPK